MDQTSYPGAGSNASHHLHQPQQGTPDPRQPVTIPVIEEQVHLDTKVVEKGSVRISKVVNEQEVPVSIPLIQEEHEIKRVAVNEYVETPPPPVRYEGDTMIIPVVQEVLVVQKKLLVVEELHITKHQVQTQETQHVNLRKEEIRIERINPDGTGATGPLGA